MKVYKQLEMRLTGEQGYAKDVDEYVTNRYSAYETAVLGNSCPCVGHQCGGIDRLQELNEMCHQ